MKGFHFRLETVLGIRRFELERARLRLAQALRAEERARAAALRAAREADAAAQSHAQTLFAGSDAARLRALAQAVRDRRETAALAGARAGEAAERTRAARGEVVQAHGAVRALEILREKALASWRAESARRAQIELDEVAVMRAARARGASPARPGAEPLA